MIAEMTYGRILAAVRSGLVPSELEEAHREWTRDGFTEIKDVVSAEWLRWIAACLYPHLSAVAERQEIPSTMKDGRPSGGQRLSRVDPGRPNVPEGTLRKMNEVYARFSLREFGLKLAEDLKPLVSSTVNGAVEYDRIYFLLYGTGDYISPHDDEQTGQRINVQLPVCVNGVAGLRVRLDDWVTYPDEAGLLRFLGPGIWHEVLPLIGAPDAIRMNITLRYWLKS